MKKVVPATGETTIFVYDAGGKRESELPLISAVEMMLRELPKIVNVVSR